MTEAAPAQAPSSPQRLHVTSAFPAAGASGPVDGVALVTIDRQEALNALSFDLLDELADELERLDADDACRAIVLTGAGTRAFAAGADIKELATQTPITLTSREPVRGLGPDRRGADADDRRGPRLRPRRRLRAGDELRHDRRRRRRPVRPARDQDRGHARRRRHPAADAGDRQGEGDGADPHRPDDARRGSGGGRASSRRSSRPNRRSTRRSTWPPGSPPSRRSPCGPRSRRSSGPTNCRSPLA